MSLVVPNVGELVFLSRLLAPSGAENYTLKLFASAHVPAAGDVEATLDAIEASFTGYTAKTLLPGSWGAPAVVGGIASSTYSGAPQTWTNGGAAPQTIYGYYVVGATSGTLFWEEAFSTPRTLNQGDTLNLTPVFTLT